MVYILVVFHYFELDLFPFVLHIVFDSLALLDQKYLVEYLLKLLVVLFDVDFVGQRHTHNLIRVCILNDGRGESHSHSL